MNPRLELCPSALPGFLKVSASVGEMDVHLSGWNGEMPVLQLEEAGIVIELEFFDVRGLERLTRRLGELVGQLGSLESLEPRIEVGFEQKARRKKGGAGAAARGDQAERPPVRRRAGRTTNQREPVR